MSAIRVHLFGGIRVVRPGLPEARLAPVLQTLLAYLLVERRRSHPRAALAAVLWADLNEERARACLNTALWRLRAVLEPEGTPRGAVLLSTAAGDVAFNEASDHWLDIDVFEREVTHALAQPLTASAPRDVETLTHVLGLYTGDVLEGCFDDWAVRERERLRLLHVTGLEYLMRYHRLHADDGASIAVAQEILRHDAVREDVHREIMEMYSESGQHTRAMQQFAVCRKELGRELGIPPGERTRALYTRILAGSDTAHGPAVPAGEELDDLRRTVHELSATLARLRVAQEDVERAIERLQGDERHAARMPDAARLAG